MAQQNLKREVRRDRLLERGLDRDMLLLELAQAIRTLKQSLPAYQRVQEPIRYQMTVEDVQEHERNHATFKLDFHGEYTDDEIMDALLNAMATGDVITHVLQNGPGQAAPAKTGGGCIVPLVAATGGIAAAAAAVRFLA